MQGLDMYSQHRSTIWKVCLNGWVSVYEQNACGLESRCSHLKNYDARLAIQEPANFNFKTNITTIGLEKYFSFNLNNKLVFIDSF